MILALAAFAAIVLAEPQRRVFPPRFPGPIIPRPGFPGPIIPRPGFPGPIIPRPEFPGPIIPRPGLPSPRFIQPTFRTPISPPGPLIRVRRNVDRIAADVARAY